MIIKKRNYLKKKKIKEIKKELGQYGSLINNKSKVEVLETDEYDYILVDGEPYIIMIDNKPYPTLKSILANNELENKTVYEDILKWINVLLGTGTKRTKWPFEKRP